MLQQFHFSYGCNFFIMCSSSCSVKFTTVLICLPMASVEKLHQSVVGWNIFRENSTSELVWFNASVDCSDSL